LKGELCFLLYVLLACSELQAGLFPCPRVLLLLFKRRLLLDQAPGSASLAPGGQLRLQVCDIALPACSESTASSFDPLGPVSSASLGLKGELCSLHVLCHQCELHACTAC
jgi:hypothetical protein